MSETNMKVLAQAAEVLSGQGDDLFEAVEPGPANSQQQSQPSKRQSTRRRPWRRTRKWTWRRTRGKTRGKTRRTKSLCNSHSEEISLEDVVEIRLAMVNARRRYKITETKLMENIKDLEARRSPPEKHRPSLQEQKKQRCAEEIQPGDKKRRRNRQERESICNQEEIDYRCEAQKSKQFLLLYLQETILPVGQAMTASPLDVVPQGQLSNQEIAPGRYQQLLWGSNSQNELFLGEVAPEHCQTGASPAQEWQYQFDTLAHNLQLDQTATAMPSDNVPQDGACTQYSVSDNGQTMPALQTLQDPTLAEQDCASEQLERSNGTYQPAQLSDLRETIFFCHG